MPRSRAKFAERSRGPGRPGSAPPREDGPGCRFLRPAMATPEVELGWRLVAWTCISQSAKLHPAVLPVPVPSPLPGPELVGFPGRRLALRAMWHPLSLSEEFPVRGPWGGQPRPGAGD